MQTYVLPLMSVIVIVAGRSCDGAANARTCPRPQDGYDHCTNIGPKLLNDVTAIFPRYFNKGTTVDVPPSPVILSLIKYATFIDSSTQHKLLTYHNNQHRR